MKIRTGFVSNSSSASFLVRRIDMQNKLYLTNDQMNLLEDFGFYRTNAYYPDQVKRETDLECDLKYSNYGYDVVCNEDEVMDFLIDHLIPFTSECHYGQYNVCFDGNEIVTAANLGKFYMMNVLGEYTRRNPFKVKSIEEYKKEGGY